MTIREVLDAYVADLTLRGARPGSQQNARRIAARLSAVLGEQDAERITPSVINQYAGLRLAEGIQASTINHHLKILRAALRRAHEDGLIDRLPRVRGVRANAPVPTYLTAEQLDRLERAAWEISRDAGLAVAIARYAGLRHQEILHLQWRDITAEAVTVCAKPEVDWTPKTHAERRIPTAPALWAAVKPHRRGRSPDAWVFPGHRGKPKATLTPEIADSFRYARLHDRKLRPGLHLLRRSWATLLAGAGVDIATLRELGGWSSLAVVERYVRSTPARKIDAILRAFGGADEA